MNCFRVTAYHTLLMLSLTLIEPALALTDGAVFFQYRLSAQGRPFC